MKTKAYFSKAREKCLSQSPLSLTDTTAQQVKNANLNWNSADIFFFTKIESDLRNFNGTGPICETFREVNCDNFMGGF